MEEHAAGGINLSTICKANLGIQMWEKPQSFTNPHLPPQFFYWKYGAYQVKLEHFKDFFTMLAKIFRNAWDVNVILKISFAFQFLALKDLSRFLMHGFAPQIWKAADRNLLQNTTQHITSKNRSQFLSSEEINNQLVDVNYNFFHNFLKNVVRFRSLTCT